jgi:hypothetical protein
MARDGSFAAEIPIIAGLDVRREWPLFISLHQAQQTLGIFY